MANAGNHNDTRLLKQMIREGKLLTVSDNDHPVARKIKVRFNDIVQNDHAENRKYMGKSYVWHSAYGKLTNTSIWVNQLRFKHWYFETIK